MDRQNFTTLYKASGMNDTQEMPGLSGPSAPEHFKAIQDFVKVVSPITFCIGYPLNWLVFYIFSRSKLKTTSSSRYIAAIAFVDNVEYSSLFVGNKVNGHTTLCMPYHAPSLMETWSFLNHVDYVIVAIIPYLTIVILLGLIIVKLCTYKSNVRQVRGSLRGRLPSVNTEQEFKTMPLVIAVAVTTIALGLLFNIYRIFRIMDQNTHTVALCFYQISFACKFFSYVMTSESFRDHLTMLCRQCIYHGPGIPLCRGHSESEPTTFISVNQQTHSSTEDHCIIEGTV
uniref:G-protein coupled receptors family 1 profile domain-containing protein n=1 Tax=Magallana gigas TaxID=29159 RepID=A0A8W8MVM8_MAGGI